MPVGSQHWQEMPITNQRRKRWFQSALLNPACNSNLPGPVGRASRLTLIGRLEEVTQPTCKQVSLGQRRLGLTGINSSLDTAIVK
jgi:hypothetical protein